MDAFKKLPLNKKILLSSIIVASVSVILLIIFLYVSPEKKENAAKDYNTAEQQIADSVKAYLSLYIELTDEEAAQAADAAVENYNIIMSSGTDVVNDSHTDIIKKRIGKVLALMDETENLAEDEFNSLTAGIAEIIWNAVLSQIEEAVIPDDYKQEYLELTESIQEQIDVLAEQKMKIHISAHIKDKDEENDDSIDVDALLAAIDAMTDDDLEKLAAALGLSPEELQKLINANNLNLDKELEERFDGLKKELSEELLRKYTNMGTNDGKTGTNGVAGQNGTNGKNGKDGKNGIDGKDGKNGEDGTNGKTTYIAYADDTDGTGFSLTPTETSKFVGTCITDADKQPTDYQSYGNWQIYRTYIITTTTDENDVTTLHIN